MMIDGEWSAAVDGKSFAVEDPGTGEVIAEVPEGSEADVDRAVDAARQAFDERRWLSVPPSKRDEILWRIADMIEHGELPPELDSLDAVEFQEAA